jgi:hypothetical protein
VADAAPRAHARDAHDFDPRPGAWVCPRPRWCNVTDDQTMAEGRLPAPVEDVVYRELNGEIVLVHLGTDRIYALNETGARFWELLAAGSDRAAIRAQLFQEFSVEPAELDAEIDALLAELARAGLVT